MGGSAEGNGDRGLLLLLSGEFVRLVVVAFVLAAPVAYVLMYRWLEGFVYHVDLSWPVFLGAGLVALGVTLVSVGYQTINASRADPVKSLRYE